MQFKIVRTISKDAKGNGAKAQNKSKPYVSLATFFIERKIAITLASIQKIGIALFLSYCMQVYISLVL